MSSISMITFKPDERQKTNGKNQVKDLDKPGKITESIGTGDNARNSFIYLVLKWSFIAGCVVTLLIVANYWFFQTKEKVPDLIGDVKVIWDIITPLITLALGYAFGKAKE